MNYLIAFIIFILATLSLCSIRNVIQIKIERRLGIAKKPWLMFIRYLPGFFNHIVHMLILFFAIFFSYKTMNGSIEYTLIPLIFIFITKLFMTNREPNTIYFELIGMTSIIIFILPTLFDFNALDVLSYISAAVAVKIFNNNDKEQPSLNAARNIALNSYITFVLFPDTNYIFCMVFAILLGWMQQLIQVFIPRFNEIRNMRRIFRWGLMLALSILIINAVMIIVVRG